MDETENDSLLKATGQSVPAAPENPFKFTHLRDSTLVPIPRDDKQITVAALVFWFSLPAVVFLLVGYACVDSLSLRNRAAWFYGFGIHAAVLTALWYLAVKFAAIEHGDNSLMRSVVTGIILAAIYIPSAILCWVMVALAVLPV